MNEQFQPDSATAEPTAAAATVASPLAREVARRRTFAIISHPDAGKTTLTEKLLLYAGAIELAGAVLAHAGAGTTRVSAGRFRLLNPYGPDAPAADVPRECDATAVRRP